MKILSFLAMLGSMALLIILSLLYCMFRQSLGVAGIWMFTVGMIVAVYLLIFSLVVVKDFKWGDKHSFTPMT